MFITWNEKLRMPSDEFISLSKPARFYDLMSPGATIVPSELATPAQLKAVHADTYVDDVLAGRTAHGFGFEPRVLEQILAANGALIAAVRLVTEERVPICCAPVSGFHHAGLSTAWGFCTFNGLMAAVFEARARGYARRVLIVDGDGHYGDGTADIISRHHVDAVQNFSLRSPRSRAHWAGHLEDALQSERWDLILYQSGADSHVSDPYGVGYLDDRDWALRDDMVFSYATRHGIPCVWNLAGGYNGDKTIELHAATARAAYLYTRSATEGAIAAQNRQPTDGPAFGELRTPE